MPPARTAREYAADALAVGRELLGERFTVVGLSLGGAAALHLALEAPDAVGSLVLACTFAGMRSYAGHDLGPPPTVPPAPARIDPRLVEASGAHAPSFSQSFRDGSAELFWEIVRLSEATPTRPDLDDVQIEQFASHDVVDRLGEIAVPTEVICGALDRTMPLGNSRLLAGEIADSRLTVVPEAGHALHMETPTRLAGAIRAAVDRWVRS